MVQHVLVGLPLPGHNVSDPVIPVVLRVSMRPMRLVRFTRIHEARPLSPARFIMPMRFIGPVTPVVDATPVCMVTPTPFPTRRPSFHHSRLKSKPIASPRR
ncbi:hypothetical protein TGARI_215955 [Toxoplasma gondii ARI]|uniref:Uncharacterized protein n=1 Tax=Toxoplasma gondii ARI TaxID=1074872 RepID=A0A139XKG4_TOXGO|nr:hypothetical protein TGARI_215955 [Toxoplasma gondii ARI]